MLFKKIPHPKWGRGFFLGESIKLFSTFFKAILKKISKFNGVQQPIIAFTRRKCLPFKKMERICLTAF
jgi:hypothetical protein